MPWIEWAQVAALARWGEGRGSFTLEEDGGDCSVEAPRPSEVDGEGQIWKFEVESEECMSNNNNGICNMGVG